MFLQNMLDKNSKRLGSICRLFWLKTETGMVASWWRLLCWCLISRLPRQTLNNIRCGNPASQPGPLRHTAAKWPSGGNTCMLVKRFLDYLAFSPLYIL